MTRNIHIQKANKQMGITGHQMDNGATIYFNTSNEEIMVEQDGTQIHIEAKWLWMFFDDAVRSARIAEIEQMNIKDLLSLPDSLPGMENMRTYLRKEEEALMRCRPSIQ